MKAIHIIICLFGFLSTIKAVAGEIWAEQGQSFSSPNKKFTAKLDDDQGYISIKNNVSGKLYETMSVRSYTPSGYPMNKEIEVPIRSTVPLYLLKWTGDSKTIIIVSHVAGGSTTSIIHFSSDKWRCIIGDPPRDHFPETRQVAVLNLNIGWDTIRLRYKVERQQNNGRAIGWYTCVFNINSETGFITNFDEHKIDFSTYRDLKGIGLEKE